MLEVKDTLPYENMEMDERDKEMIWVRIKLK